MIRLPNPASMLVAVALTAGSAAHAQDRNAGRDVGFTWWNDLPALIERGNEAYFADQLTEAEDAYSGAQLLAPDSPVASFNRGIVHGRQGSTGEAIDAFERAIQRAGEDASLRARANYNLGLMHWERAYRAIAEDEDIEASLEEALRSLDRFEDALRYDPANDAARENRSQVQHFLEMFAREEPPPEQEEQQEESRDDDEEDGDQEQEMPQPEMDDDGDEPDQQPMPGEDELAEQDIPTGEELREEESDETEGESQPDQQDEEGEPQDGDPDEAQPDPGEDESPEQPGELTPEQARELLNLLGERQDIVLRHGGARRPDPEKFW